MFAGLLLANDMGGAPLAEAVGKSPELAAFNGLVVSTMMGCTVSFTMAWNGAYVAPVVVGKLVAGVAGLALATVIEKRTDKKA